MRFPHFFKACSRLGLPNPPHRIKQLNVGVEDAPDFILTPKFLSQISQYEVTDYIFPKPEEINPTNYWSILSWHLKVLTDLINNSLKKGQTQIVVGGDNSVTFSSLLVILHRFPAEDIGYIQFDAHGEINSYKSSPTKNFHGMYLRPLVTDFDILEINRLVNWKIPTQNLFFIGISDINPGDEQDFFQRVRLKVFSSEYLKLNRKQVLAELNQFIKRFQHIHINFDIDTFDQSIAPGTGIPTAHGLFWEDVLPLLKICAQHPSLSLDLSEVNPQKDPVGKTVRIAQQVLDTILK